MSDKLDLHHAPRMSLEDARTLVEHALRKGLLYLTIDCYITFDIDRMAYEPRPDAVYLYPETARDLAYFYEEDLEVFWDVVEPERDNLVLARSANSNGRLALAARTILRHLPVTQDHGRRCTTQFALFVQFGRFAMEIAVLGDRPDARWSTTGLISRVTREAYAAAGRAYPRKPRLTPEVTS